MAIDFDSLVLAPCQQVFGEPVFYDSELSGTFELSGIFDKAYESVVVQEGQAISERMPVIGCRSSQFPTYPKQGDKLTVQNERYLVREVRDDSHGNIKLMLNGPVPE